MLKTETVDEFRERMAEKAAARRRFKFFYDEAAESQRRRPKEMPKAEKSTELVSKKPPRVPKPKVIPCPDCERPTRPSGTTPVTYPGTMERRGHGLCGLCTTVRNKQKQPPRICQGCDKHLPVASDLHRKWCSDSCRRGVERAQKRNAANAAQ